MIIRLAATDRHTLIRLEGTLPKGSPTRREILSVLTSKLGTVFPTKEALSEYLKEHPKADRSKHSVKEPGKEDSPGEKPKIVYRPPSPVEISRAKQEHTKTSWIKPSLEDEAGEIERTSQDLGIPKEKLDKAGRAAKLEPLDEDTWSKLENTDSYDTDTVGKAQKLSKKYNRDIASVLNGMGKELPAPIVLIHKGTPYLIGGNTRLMASRSIGAKPKVLMIRI